MSANDITDSICLVCNSNLLPSSGINIFYTSLPRNGPILSNFIFSLLHLMETDLQSSSICSQCYMLFQMLEQAQSTVTNIQNEIIKIYQSKDKNKIHCDRTNEQDKITIENLLEINSQTLNTTSNLDQLNRMTIFDTARDHNLPPENRTNITINPEIQFNDQQNLENEQLQVDNIEIEQKNHAHNSQASDAFIQENKCINIDTEPINNKSIELINDDCEFPKETELNSNKINKKTEKSKHNSKPLKYSCETCGKKWKTTSELKTHMKSHSESRPYMCEKCGKAYKNKNALQIHIGMHNGINPFQCNYCNKSFTQSISLRRHLPIHTGEMPYQCDLCGKRFLHHTSYNMHVLSHTGQKNHRCHICDTSLLSTSHLKRHMRVHTGEKSFSCTVCGKRFAERYNLFVHQKIHNSTTINSARAKNIQYKCDQCSVTFNVQEKLDNHVEQYHNSIVQDSNDETDNSWRTLTYNRLQTPYQPANNVDNYKNLESMRGTCQDAFSVLSAGLH